MSIWTVIGAVAASVLTAGVLGSASGIMQIPTISSDLAMLRTARETMMVAIGALSERVRSNELNAEAMQRQLNAQSTRMDTLEARIEKANADLRAESVHSERDIAALEGRSQNRNTEAEGMVNALKNAVDSLADRQRVTQDAMQAIRQQIYELAMRGYSRNSLPGLPAPTGPSSNPSLWPPTKDSGQRFDTSSPHVCGQQEAGYRGGDDIIP